CCCSRTRHRRSWPSASTSPATPGRPWPTSSKPSGPSPTADGTAPSSAPTTTPNGRSRWPAPCASGTSPSSRCCCSSTARSSATSRFATTSSTTSASTRSTPVSWRPASSTSSTRVAEARLMHLCYAGGRGARPELVEYGDLVLNLETYQAVVAGRPLDLTYMEYELLTFLASNPGKVFTRETLLSRVWGYEYYGGARTVDVHVRRLRAKLGEEHAGLISTVRSVGYRFGQSRWGS